MNGLVALSARRSAAARLVLVVAVLIAALVAGSSAHAAATDAPPPTRDHGHGRWFRHVCSLPSAKAAWCGAQVVTNENGVPLASPSPPASAITPAGFHTAYALPATSVAGTPTIAIVDAFDDPNIESDLAAFNAQFGLPPCTTANGCFKKVDGNGGTSYPTGTSWHLEIALDVEMAHAICQNCKILLVEASSSSLAALGTAVNTAVALGANVVSNSYGGSEFSSETSYETTYYRHPGVAITVSSGDSGYGVEFPAASQYVTAVGGTTLALNTDKSYRGETVWSGAGSGCSAYVPKPTWQKDAGCTRRTVADVSADADPNSGAAIYDSVGAASGQAWFQVGGTSLAAPLVGAVYALTGGTTAGYGSAPYGQPSLLNDVTSGSNGTCATAYLCTGGAGYDAPSGLGTPRGLGAFAGATAPAGDFSLSASPASGTAVAGGTAAYAVTVTPTNGFNASSVTLGTANLPTGATASFNGSNLTVSVAATVPAGTYGFSITGTGGGLTHSTPATLVVQDFSLSVAPASQSVTAGATATYTVTVSPSNGFGGSVNLAVSGLPTGATAAFSPAVATTTSTLTVTTPTATAGGTYPLTITGTSGAASHSTSASLGVQAAPAGDFALGAPSTGTVTAGGQTTFAVTVTGSNGFSSAVSLGQSGLPAGASASFSPSSPAAGTSSTLTITTTSALAAGSYPFTITGTGGGLTHSVNSALVVNAAATPDFALGISVATATVTQGASAAYTVTVSPSDGFSDPVSLSAAGLPSGAVPSFGTNPATSTSSLTVTTSGVATGSYPFTINGTTTGGLSHSVAATLVVQPQPDFSLTVAPGSQTVTAGGQTTYTVGVTASNGFSGAVSLAASGLPSGVSAAFSPQAPTTSSTLTVATTSAVAAGSYPITVTGTSGSLVHTAPATLVVQAAAAAKPTLSVSPGSAPRGSSVTVTWSGVTSPSTTDWIGVFHQGAANTSYLSYEYDSSCRTGFVSAARSSGSCSFRVPSAAGTYELRLMANNGFTPIVTGVLVVAT